MGAGIRTQVQKGHLQGFQICNLIETLVLAAGQLDFRGGGSESESKASTKETLTRAKPTLIICLCLCTLPIIPRPVSYVREVFHTILRL